MNRFHLNGKYEYCPNGNYWQEVSGIFDRAIYLFCDCNKCGGQVYQLKVFNITKKVNKEKIKNFREWNELEDVRGKVTIKNMEKVKSLLNNEPNN